MLQRRRTLTNSVALLAGLAFLVGCDDDDPPTTMIMAPDAPTGVTAMWDGFAVQLAWTASTGATSYTVQRAPSGGTFADIATSVTGTTFEDRAVGAGSFDYQVVAVNSSGSSPASAATSVDPGLAALTDSITGTRTLSADSIYLIQGVVTVTDGGVLEIPAGTELRGDFNNQPSAIIVRVGGMMEAAGTESEPIVFTSSNPPDDRAPGDWGGVVLNGDSNCNFPAAECVGEGSSGTYGGTDLTDNSGTLTYARIEYAGFEVSFGNELNALTLNGVGSGTTIHHVQTHAGSDDGTELFGGSVDLTYMISTDISDDSFDYSTGWVGRGQFWIAQQNPDDADNGFEVDGNEEDFDATPLTDPTIYNVTLVGKGAMGEGGTDGESTRGILLRRGVAGVIECALVTGFGSAGVDLDNLQTNDNGPEINNSIFFSNAEDFSSDIDSTSTNNADLVDEATVLTDGTYGTNNVTTDPGLGAPFDRDAPDFRPAVSGPADGTCTPSGDSFFEPATYIGAVAPGGDEWYLEAWTRWGEGSSGG